MNDTKNMKSVIKALASSPLFIEKGEAIALMHRYESLISSGVFQSETLIKEHQDKMKKLTAVSFYNASNSVVTGSFGSSFRDVLSGSVAVVPVMGVMSRNSYCSFDNGYVSGTRDLENTVQMLEDNENVEGIVFYINTPGGQASGNESLSKKIQSCKTPTVGIFEMMASAGVGAFQGVDELYAIESTSQWGSIGTYISFYDDKRYWEEMGIDLIEIYAPQSSEKNKDFREALDGNPKPMEERLKKMTDAFIKQVKKARSSIKDDGKVFKGKIYTAEEAKKIGAIDGIKDLTYAISRARYLFRNGKDKKKSNAVKNQSNTMSEEKKAGWWERTFGSKTQIEAQEDMTGIKNELTSLKEEVQNLKEVATEKETKLEELTASNKELQEQLEKSSAENEKLTASIKESEKASESALEGTEFENIQELAEDHKKVIAHNIELGGREKAGTPIDNQQNVSHALNTAGEEMTASERVDAIEAKIKAEEEAKIKAKQEAAKDK